MKFPSRKQLVVSAAAILLLIGANRAFVAAQSTKVMHDLTSPLPTDRYESMLRIDTETPSQWRQFNEVWAKRNQHDITNELLPFLGSSTPALRLRTVQVLGRLESSEAQAPIEALLRDRRESSIPTISIQLAIGRVKSKKLAGQAKVEALLREAGLTWDGAIKLSQALNGSTADRSQMQNTEGEVVMDELTDMLHVMSKRGQEVQPLAEQLTLLPSQQVWIKSASLDDVKGAEMVFDFLTGLEVIRSENYRLMDHLVDWNPAVADVALSFLDDMKRNPKKYYGLEPYPGQIGAYRARMGYNPLMRVAAQTGDKRMLPYFQHFAKTKGERIGDKAVRNEAEMALENFALRAKGFLQG